MFAKRLRDLRKQKDITQIMLAQALGLSQQTIARWESGNATPPLDTISRIANFFDVPTTFFLEETSSNLHDGFANNAEQELTERQIEAICDLVSTLEVRAIKKNAIELSPDYCGTVEKVLRENDEIMTHTFNALSLVLDALIIGSLELSKVKLNRTIAEFSKESFDYENAVREAKERVAEKIALSATIISKIMKALPEAFFKEIPPEGGDPDGEH